MPVPMLKVVDETPELAQGETAEKPMPAPNAMSNRVSAPLAKPPAITAPHEMAARGAAADSIRSDSAATMETSAALVGHGASSAAHRLPLGSCRRSSVLITELARLFPRLNPRNLCGAAWPGCDLDGTEFRS